MTRALIVGIGNPLRGDDGVGHAAAEALLDVLPEADVAFLDGEPTRLIDAWEDRDLAIIIDAVRSGGLPGTLHRVQVGVDPLPQDSRGHSTHGAGLEAAVQLAKALDRTPRNLVVWGVEPADMSQGHGLSPEVSMALPYLVERIAAEVRGLCV